MPLAFFVCILALQGGADLKQVQSLLGHSDPSTTMKFYAGVTDEM